MGKFPRGSPTAGHSRDSAEGRKAWMWLCDWHIFDHFKPEFHPKYDRVEGGIVLFCDGMILIQRAPVSLPIPWFRSIVSLETEVADESVDDPTNIDGSRLLGPVSDLGSTGCSLAGDPDERLQENGFSSRSVRSHVGYFHHAWYGLHYYRELLNQYFWLMETWAANLIHISVWKAIVRRNSPSLGMHLLLVLTSCTKEQTPLNVVAFGKFKVELSACHALR